MELLFAMVKQKLHEKNLRNIFFLNLVNFHCVKETVFFPSKVFKFRLKMASLVPKKVVNSNFYLVLDVLVSCVSYIHVFSLFGEFF